MCNRFPDTNLQHYRIYCTQIFKNVTGCNANSAALRQTRHLEPGAWLAADLLAGVLT